MNTKSVASFSAAFLCALCGVHNLAAQVNWEGGSLPDIHFTPSGHSSSSGSEDNPSPPLPHVYYPHAHYNFFGELRADDGWYIYDYAGIDETGTWVPVLRPVSDGTPSKKHRHWVWEGDGETLRPAHGWIHLAGSAQWKVVRFRPGRPVPGKPHWVFSEEEPKITPARGYIDLHPNDPNSFEVAPIAKEAEPVAQRPRWETDKDFPRDARITNNDGDRRADKYSQVIAQFDVKHDPRYARDDHTYCNIFVWDVTRAMGAELPHWVSGPNADPVPHEQGQALNVNRLSDWLNGHGRQHGWALVSASSAQYFANQGKPTVAIWKNPESGVDPDNKHGHVAVVRPGSLPLANHGPALAQAGGHNDDATHLTRGFNDPKNAKDIQFWYHD